MPVIDVHGHYGCPSYSADAQTPDQILAVMKMFGIERTILASSLAITTDMEAGNAELAEAIAGHEQLLGYVLVNPNNPEQSSEEMRKYLGHRQFAGAKMHRSHHGQPLDSPECLQILKALLRYDKPLLVHADDALGELENLAKAYTSCPFILAGMGGEQWPAALRMAKRVTNVYLDAGGEPDVDRVKRAVEQVGVHRLVFGTGTPLTHPLYALGMVRDSDISPNDKDRILYRNAMKLFKLG